jgi:pimeloyl-ACP methyl ester carboxylesterase
MHNAPAAPARNSSTATAGFDLRATGFFTRLALGAIALLALGRPATAQAIVQDIPAASGSAQVLYAGPPSPRAILFMFAGGDGTVAFNTAGQITHMNGNFLMRTENLWLAQGFAYATLGAPSSLMGQRHTPAYADTVARAIDFVRTRANVPVWLVGTSMGSIAAANGAAHLPGRVAGVVLSSSVAGANRAANETVFDSDLGAIAVPALIVANRGDTCPSAGPGFAPQILAALTRSPRKELIYVESQELRSDPCEAMSPHGYLGIEADVVQRIADWIRATPGR